MVRDVNTKIPTKKQPRVLLGNHLIEWELVHTKEDDMKFDDRDLSLGSVVQREVLSKKRRVLLIEGGMAIKFSFWYFDRFDSGRDAKRRRYKLAD